MARKALELDEHLSEAHVALAITQFLGDWDWDGAEQSLRTALELNPSDAWAHAIYALELTYLGRFDDAIAHFESALERDPLNTGSPVETDLGRVYELNGDLDGAMREWRRVLELDPDNRSTHRHMGNSYCQRGEYERGIELLERARTLAPNDSHIAADLAHCYAVSDEQEAALEIVRTLDAYAEQTYISPVNIALIRIGLGQNDVALDWLERAYEVRALRTPSIGIDPRFDPLRAEPRFQELLRRTGLADRRTTARQDA